MSYTNDGLIKFLNDRRAIRDVIKIDDKSTAALVNEIRNNPILVLDTMGAIKLANHRRNYLQAQLQVLTAKLIQRIEASCAGSGKAIASTAKDKLIKTTLPLFPEYANLQYLLDEVDTELEYLKSLYYVLVERGKILMEMVKMDRAVIGQQATPTQTNALDASIGLFENELKRLNCMGSDVENSAANLMASTNAYIEKLKQEGKIV